MNEPIKIFEPTIENALLKNGFATAKLLGEKELYDLRNLYDKYFSEIVKKDKYNVDSNSDCNSDLKRTISNEIHKVVKPCIDKIFDDYEFIPAIFFVKKPGANSPVPMHQDPTLLIDECEKTHIKIWCPLLDVDGTNGTLQMIKGSHLFVPPVSAVTVPSHFSKVDSLLYKAMECVPVKAGDALMFDNRTIHCSMPNLTDQTRITVIVSIVAKQRQFISLFSDTTVKNPPIEVYYQDKDWYYSPLWCNTHERPKTGRRVGILDYHPFFVKGEDFESLVKNPRALVKYKYRIVSDMKYLFSKLGRLFSLAN